MKLTSSLNTLLRTLRLYRPAAFLKRTVSGIAVPDDFDWEYYLEFYPDLQQAGLRSKADALNHYVQHGFFEKRFTRKQGKHLILEHDRVRLQQLNNIRLFNEQQRRIITNGLHARTITVSVVITVYNYALYIDACLNSVLSSTFKDIEIIIVNDCSTDDSLALSQAFFACGVPITIIDKKTNTGVAHSRNLGILQGRGDYVFILDIDNEIYPRCLEEHLMAMQSNSALIACYAVIDMYDEAGVFCGQNSNQPFDFKKLYNGNYIDTMAMFNRQKLIAVGAYDERLLERGTGYEDYELWLRIGRQGKSVGFIEHPLSRYLKKQGSMLSIAAGYYHIPLQSFLRQKYFMEHPCGGRTAVLIAGMHRSGTSALAGLIALMGADPGPDLIGPDQSNVKGHFEPRKIVAENDMLLERLGVREHGSGDMPADWMEREETKKARDRIREIILNDFSAQDIFVIKDPRLCLLLPLYRELFGELGITLKIIVIQRDQQEVIKSLNERDGMPPEVGLSYYKKHIRALEANLRGVEFLSVSFDQLIEAPDAVIEKITAFIPRLSKGKNRGTDLQITAFIDPAIRHHRKKPENLTVSARTVFSHMRRRLTSGSCGPDFLIIGAQRTGTTSLYQNLCLHPHIQAPATKELHWFHAGPAEDDGYHTGHKSQQWYELQFRPSKTFVDYFHPGKRKLAFEATPEYLFHPVIAEKVNRLYPETKIIALVRDPLERAISQYYHEKKHGFIEADLCIEEYFSRDHAITAEEEPKLLSDHAYYSYEYEHHCPVSRSNYARQLDRWLRVFPRHQIMIVRSETMFRNPYPVLNSICSFLGIKPYPESLATTLTRHSSCVRSRLSEEQRKKLTAYFPFDLSVDKFCTPPGYY